MKYIIEQFDGTKINVRDIQLKSLQILEDFDNFCKKYNLSYTLCGGCCIGALRHEGFIPWDDDIDVHMFRDDYEKFEKLWKKHGKYYRLVKTTKNSFQDTMLTQLSDPNTLFIKEHQKGMKIDHGLKLEIIPLDGAPSSKFKRLIQLFWANVFYLFNRGFIPQNKGFIVRLLSTLVLTIFNTPQKRVRIWKYAEKQMTKYPIESSKYVTELCVTWKYMKIKYPKEIFEGKRYEIFENKNYPVPFNAEKYLEMAFGNYMELPEKNKRVPKHDTYYINLNIRKLKDSNK